MASRLMHIIIADEVSKRLNVEDRSAFLLGSIAPDATSDKKLTHYFEGDASKFTRKINLDEFSENYDLSDDFILGYFVHLITDDFWISGFYLPWLKYLIENTESLKDDYIADFTKLNYLLTKQYPEITKSVDKIVINDNILEINSVLKDNLEHVLSEVKFDIGSNIVGELKVFTFVQIIGFIETTVNKCIYYIKQSKVY